MPDPTRSLDARRLQAWANDLSERENELAAEQTRLAAERTRFEDQARRFKAKAEALVTRKTEDIADALEMIREAFPMGFIFAPLARSAMGSVH